MAVTTMGLSTLGVTFGYGTGTDYSTASYTQLERISSIGEVSADPESIDVSTLEDYATKYVEGRTSVSDSVAVVVNWTSETATQWETAMSAASGTKIFFETIIPGMDKATFFEGALPSILPTPSIDQNGAFTNTINIKVKNYIGWQTKKAFS